MNKILDNEIYLKDIEKVLSNIDLNKLNGKSILITGGLGLICSAIVDVLFKANQDIKIFIGTRNENKFNNRYGGCNNIFFVKYDALEDIEFSHYFDYIICGAGLSSPELFVQKPVETMLSNLKGLNNLLNYGLANKCKRLLYISSSEVYGNKTDENSFVEDKTGNCSINNIRDSYSEAKRACEVLCKSYSEEYKIDTVIVRPGHIFGPTASINDKRVSSEFIRMAALGSDLSMKSAGLQKRSYCYSLDCAGAILHVLLNGISKEAYNIGHSQITSIREMATIVARAGDVNLSIKEPTQEELKTFNPMNNSSLNSDKLNSIGYNFIFNVNEGLVHSVQILKEMYKNSI